MSRVSGPGPAGSAKEKRSFSKRLFRGRAAGGGAGSAPAATPAPAPSGRSLGGFMSRVLKTLSTLSHYSSEPEPRGALAPRLPPPQATGGLGSCFPPGPPRSPEPPPRPAGGSEPVPGVAGLRNHGNTCFMNAILQCLSNTELFAEFLALEQFRGGPPPADGPPPAPGEVTEQLAQLVRALWTLEYTPQHSRDFKNIVSKNAMQYRGNAQHDAQEFLLWLLDRVHEDLNNVVNSGGMPPLKPPLEDDVLLEGPAFPISSTFVQELFQAQYRSSLTCPHCQKQSNTFDPFLCISLPIPLPHTRPLYVTVVYQGKCSHCMRIGVAVPISGTVARLREAVSSETKIPTEQIVLTEMYYDGFHRSFCDTDDLDTIHESDCIFAFETPETFRPEGILSQRGIHVNNNLNNLKCGTEHSRTIAYSQGTVKSGKLEQSCPKLAPNDKIVLLVCNRACTGQQSKRFGLPFVLHLEKTIAWDILQKEILEKMQYFLRPAACLQVCPFSLRVVSVVGITYLLPQEERPLCHPTVERALKSCGQGGTAHVKLVVEWDKETKDYLFVNTEEEYIPDSESVRQQRELHHQPQTCTLSQCFQLYTKEEQLAPDDAWRCPHCKQLQQGSITLSLWTLPDVLIIHLKRFRQEGDRRMKLQNMVKFPLSGLDMTPHVVKRSQSSWSLPSHWSPWRKPYGLGRDPEDYIYDLYAVCNHHGTMQGGHYTGKSYCKNSVDGQWYCFDDSEVQQLSESEVCKQTAYILFYQRRTAIPSWSANSSVAGSTSSSLCEHWLSRLPGSKQPSVASAASSRRTSLASLSESVELAGERSEDDGGFSTRPFVRSVQRQSLSSRSSVTSPLAVSENGVRPSWSLSAKLQFRSNSPSRFSGDSPVHTSASTLEKIGEAADDKVSTSCFGSLRNLSSSYLEPCDSRREHRTARRAPLAVMEGAFREESVVRTSSSDLSDGYGKSSVQPDRSHPALDPFDNNNQIAFVDQSDSVDSSPVKEVKAPAGTGLAAEKAHDTPKKGHSSKGASEPDKSLRKGRTVLAPQETKVSHSSPPLKSSQKASRSRSKADSSRVSGRHGSPAPTQARKDHSTKPLEASVPSAQQKQKSGSPSSTAAKKTPSGSLTKGSSSGKSRPSERSLSREGSKVSLGSDKASVTSSSRTSSPRISHSRSDSRAADSRHVRSASTASLRSPGAAARAGLRRDSKSEEKGLSFFKSALRQKETRRSADLGKTTMLSKKTGSAGSKSGGKNVLEDKPEKGGVPPASQTNANITTKEKLVSKDATSNKHSLLSSRKSKSSQLDPGVQSPPSSGKQSADKPLKKLPSSMQVSVRPSLEPQ
ncbi:UBP31 hydrolase, partial [Cercotrichas coryphoeus]|nr:UBP31 hydrolase [Cercotrichas coryphoeus]